MTKVLWTVTALLLVQAAHSYILLTANIEDVQNIARDLLKSPVGGQVGNIMRRAYSIFNNQLGKDEAENRADDKEGGPSGFQLDDAVDYRRNNKAPYQRSEARSEEKTPSPSKRSNTNERAGQQDKGSENTRQNDQEFSALGKSASDYLQNIQKVLKDSKDIL